MVINRDAGTWESANGSAGKMRRAVLFGTFQEPQKGCLSAVEMRRVSFMASEIWVSANVKVKVAIFAATRE